ncbi:polysaccharide biosynthesis/export family protein [Hydrogenophaga pseudoflava]|uniref:polysaccharide biosynthesis/export family protein n=1 Tax=Hydrogenophaga pseudoflava TaxID=47421 RepID=UPI0027E5AD81|nr:polysaccharide biosynthesis/export family protein [Hydrogenophaga pseudoflava]MDQ7747041.1 polysaccharide biosynthesis/export family protein [Hydrogenophaga pseudoflava]
MDINTTHHRGTGTSRPHLKPFRRALLLGSVFAGAAFAQTPVQPLQQEPLQTPVDSSRQPARPVVTESAAAVGTTKGAGAAPTPADVAPLNSLAAVKSDYRIGANDLLEFDVFGVPDMKRSVRVNGSGAVSLPLIGSVQLAGLTAQEAEAQLAQKYGENYLQNPQVSVFIKEFTTQRITIEGAVAKPGIYPVTGQLTLLRALALAGGGAQYAELSEIMLFRNAQGRPADPLVFDLEKIRSGAVPDPLVQSDDVIVVKRNPKRTALRDSLFRDILDTINPFK